MAASIMCASFLSHLGPPPSRHATSFRLINFLQLPAGWLIEARASEWVPPSGLFIVDDTTISLYTTAVLMGFGAS